MTQTQLEQQAAQLRKLINELRLGAPPERISGEFQQVIEDAVEQLTPSAPTTPDDTQRDKN